MCFFSVSLIKNTKNVFSLSDKCLEIFCGHPVGWSQKVVFTGVWLTWLQSCLVTSKQTDHEFHCVTESAFHSEGQETLIIWCRRFTILSCFALSSPLPQTPQEIAPLSLGEEVAWSRPLARWIDEAVVNYSSSPGTVRHAQEMVVLAVHWGMFWNDRQ